MILQLAIGDNLLIKQTADALSPWGYRITHLATSSLVASASGLTSSYLELPLSSSSQFINYIGETLLLEILNGSSQVIESDSFLISGPYNKLSELQKLIGLLGENVKHLSSNDDFIDGHQLDKTVTTYEEAALTTAIEAYEWSQSFAQNFTPNDARYQRERVYQKESS